MRMGYHGRKSDDYSALAAWVKRCAFATLCGALKDVLRTGTLLYRGSIRHRVRRSIQFIQAYLPSPTSLAGTRRPTE